MIANEEILKTLKVLYVEDDEFILYSANRTLKRKVGEVFLARTGVEGVEIASKINPDIVITDIEMPEMNGLEMIKIIREKYNRHYPIIVVTAYEDEEHKTNLADGYLYKPVDIDKLFEMIIKLVTEYKNRKDSES